MPCIILHQFLKELDAIIHQNGSAIFRLPEHVDRLFKSAKLVFYENAILQKRKFQKPLKIQLKISGLKGMLHQTRLAYYGYGTMGLTPTQNKVDVSISCWEWKMGESKAGKVFRSKMQGFKLDKN